MVADHQKKEEKNVQVYGFLNKTFVFFGKVAEWSIALVC